MSFAVYDPGADRANWSLLKRDPSVRLSNRFIALNKLACEMLRVKNGEGLELAFDPERQVIRIALGGCVRLCQNKLFAWDFFNQFGIRAKGVYPAEVIGEVLYVRIGW